MTYRFITITKPTLSIFPLHPLCNITSLVRILLTFFFYEVEYSSPSIDHKSIIWHVSVIMS
jgi:hypothetical protein